MKISQLRWLFVTGVVGFAGCADQPNAAPRKEERPDKVNVDVRDGVDVDVRENGRKVDVDVKNGKVNVDVK